MAGRSVSEQGGQLAEDSVPVRDRIEIIPRPAVLGFRPCLYGGINARFQPTVFVHHHHTMIFVAGGNVAFG